MSIATNFIEKIQQVVDTKLELGTKTEPLNKNCEWSRLLSANQCRPYINKVVVWGAVKYKQTKKSNKVSSWNWAEFSHSAVEDAPAAWPKRRKLALFWMLEEPRPRIFWSALFLHLTKMAIEENWFRCGFLVCAKNFLLALLYSILQPRLFI